MSENPENVLKLEFPEKPRLPLEALRCGWCGELAVSVKRGVCWRCGTVALKVVEKEK
jgi:hypothetical protein